MKNMKLILEGWREFISEQPDPGAQYKSDDFCTEFPDACEGVFGARRADMPQVPDVGSFETELEAPPPKGLETNEPEKIPDIGQATRDYLNSSDDHGDWPRGDQAQVENISGINPLDLTPTQKDTYMHNALKKVADTESGKWKEGPWGGSVLVSQDSYLLDGHHRWAATIIWNDKYPKDQKTMTVQKIMMPIKQLLKVANAYTDAVGGERPAGGETTV